MSWFEKAGGLKPRVEIAELFLESSKNSGGVEPSGFHTDPVRRRTAEAHELFLADQELVLSSETRRFPTATSVELPREYPDRVHGELARILAGRRSVREFDPDASLPLSKLSAVLHLSYGESSRTDPGRRFVPSAGALYPLEVYLWASRVDSLPSDTLWHYAPPLGLLERLPRPDDVALSDLLSERSLGNAAVTIFIAAAFPRVRWKYGERGYRYAFLEAGHLAQNVCLVGSMLELGVCPVGAYFDDRVHDAFGLDGLNEAAIYALCIGEPA